MFDSYLNRITNSGAKTDGQQIKTDTENAINETWWSDPQSRVAYMYDFYHDDNPYVLTDIDESLSESKTPVDIKFIIVEYPSLSKDQVAYHIMFRPGEKEIDYYKDSIGKFGGEFPIGLYIDIPDDKGVYNKWMIVGTEYANQLKKYIVLPCNYVLSWIDKGRKHDMPIIVRLRNSYNNGVWASNYTITAENQMVIWMELCDYTADIFYDKRFVIDQRTKDKSKKYDSYITWRVSKIETVFPAGIYKLTLAQDMFDPEKDHMDEETGFWYANYSSLTATPEQEFVDNVATIKFSGAQEIHNGGSGKRVTLELEGPGTIPVITTPDMIWSLQLRKRDGEFEDADIKDYLLYRRTDITGLAAKYEEYDSANGDVYDFKDIKLSIDDVDYIGGEIALTGRFPGDESTLNTVTFKIVSL